MSGPRHGMNPAAGYAALQDRRRPIQLPAGPPQGRGRHGKGAPRVFGAAGGVSGRPTGEPGAAGRQGDERGDTRKASRRPSTGQFPPGARSHDDGPAKG